MSENKEIKVTYILQKDLPDYKAGTEFVLGDRGYYTSTIPGTRGDGVRGAWPPLYVENNEEWFKKKEDEPPLVIQIERDAHFRLNSDSSKSLVLSPGGALTLAESIKKLFSLSSAQKKYLENKSAYERIRKLQADAFDNIRSCWGANASAVLRKAIIDMGKEKLGYEVLTRINPEWPHSTPHVPTFDCEGVGCGIHSVKRLSDGEVFTLGDKIGHRYTSSATYNPIVKFETLGRDLVAYCADGEGVGTSFWEKQPQEDKTNYAKWRRSNF